MQCQYYWVELRPEAQSSYACLFTSSINVIAGVVADVRLPPLALPTPEQQVLSAGLSFPDLKTSYWPLILLAVLCFLCVIIIFVAGFIYENVGFKRKYLIEKAADEKYAKIFWRENGEELGVTIDGEFDPKLFVLG